jgi:hypothetical protein
MKLYHGTSRENAIKLLNQGWSPFQISSGANRGNPRYLYLTNEPENALWFAQEKGESIVLVLEDIPLEYLAVDPEDGLKDSVEQEILHSVKTKLPAYLVLTKPIGPNFFKLFKGQI